MHLAPLISDLAVILGVAGLVSFIFHKIRQPVVVGYIIAGIIVGPHTPPFQLVSDIPSIRTWAELGVIFLLFSVGLEFSFRRLAKVGISASLTAYFEIACMMATGFTVAQLLGWSFSDSIFLAAMVSISSTTIIARALEELRLKTRRFAEMIFAVLVVEDLVAVLVLVALSTLAVSKTISGVALLSAAGKLVLVMGGWFMAGYLLVPRFVRHVGRTGSPEMLTIVSIGLCLSLAVFAAAFGYSTALGAFIMGSILSESTESNRIEELIEPIRDVFAAIFFVSVGMLIEPAAIVQNFGAVVAITTAVLFGKVTFVTLGALITGQTLRTAVQVGFGLGQIGEFSFIIAGMGATLGVTSPKLYPIAVAVSLLTAFTTPYLIRISHKFAVWLESRMPLSIKTVLSRYAAWTQERRADTSRRIVFYRLLLKWSLNGIVVSVIFVLTSELLLPFLRLRMPEQEKHLTIGLVVAVLATAPFLWAMFNAFAKFRLAAGEEGPRGGTLFIFRVLTTVWVGALSLTLFPARAAQLLAIGLALIAFGLFYRSLNEAYEWFEHRFLSAFKPEAKTKGRTDLLRHLAPWDVHLVRLKVHPNAEIAGKTLAAAELRSQHGLNVVAIQRGLKSIVAPRPTDLVFPKDELLVLATDEQVEAARPWIEKPPGLEDRFRDISGYELRNVLITESSPLIGRSIRDSKIREEFNAMVVGVERRHRRIMNPDSDLPLEKEDILWIVGEKDRLDAMAASYLGTPASGALPG